MQQKFIRETPAPSPSLRVGLALLTVVTVKGSLIKLLFQNSLKILVISIGEMEGLTIGAGGVRMAAVANTGAGLRLMV